jgi:hypothetical protein
VNGRIDAGDVLAMATLLANNVRRQSFKKKIQEEIS